MGSIFRSERSPGEKKRQPTPAFCLKKSHAQRRLAGYSPWSFKELDSTKQLSKKAN